MIIRRHVAFYPLGSHGEAKCSKRVHHPTLVEEPAILVDHPQVFLDQGTSEPSAISLVMDEHF